MTLLMTLVAATTLAAPLFAPGENLALGRPYTMSTPPNYQHCTEPGDATQLTDGEVVDGYFWTQLGCVGWQSANPIILTIDLGESQALRGAAFHTAAGVAGVTWPTALLVYASDDQQTWQELGDLVRLDPTSGPPAEGYAEHWYQSDQLAGHGRYVAVVVGTGGPYVFCDEVEIYGGAASATANPAAAPVSDVLADYRAQSARLSRGLAVREAADTLRAEIAAAGLGATDQASLAERLDAAVAASATEVYPPGPATWPFGSAHAELLQVQAALWRAQGRPPLTLWQNNRWERLQPADAAPAGGLAPRLDLVLMGNEERGETLNLTNASDGDMTVDLRLAGLAGGRHPAWLTVCDIPWTEVKGNGVTAAALPAAQRTAGGWRVTVPAGTTKQLWVNVDSRTMTPGTLSGSLELASNGERFRVPLTVRVSALRLPDQLSLAVGGWDYTDSNAFDVTEANRQPLIDFLQAQRVDAPWGSGALLAGGEYDADGKLTKDPDPTRLHDWLRRWPGMRQYYIFSNNAPGFADQPADRQRIASWINYWVGEFAKHGVGPEQVVLLVLDEPHEAQQDADTVALTRAIKAAQPAVQVFTDPTYTEPEEMTAELAATVDILCPNRIQWMDNPEAFAQVFGAAQAAGKTLMFYSCSGPVRMLDPYEYHRLQAWDCFRWNMPAEFFWAFSDAGGGSSWDEPAIRGASYAPQMLGPDGCTTTKHMAAINEGRYDYEYLTLLRAAVARATAAGRRSDRVAAAEQLLAAAPGRVLGTGRQGALWTTPLDRSVADQVRLEVLTALEGLR